MTPSRVAANATAIDSAWFDVTISTRSPAPRPASRSHAAIL